MQLVVNVSSSFASNAQPICHRSLTHTPGQEFAIPLLFDMQYKLDLPQKDKMTTMTGLVQ